MAQSVDQYNTQIVSELVTNLAAVGITIDPTKWSKRNILRLLCFTFATCSAYMDQLMDALKANIEETVAKSPSANTAWIRAKMFAFQYSVDNPQIVQLINMIPTYPVIDSSLCIITACSATSSTANEVVIKVAKGNLEALDSLQIAAAQSYVNDVFPGINYTVVSLSSDKLYIDADIYFNGQYSSIIQTSVIDALNAFLLGLSSANLDGILKLTDLENTIRSVTGVNDVVMNNVCARADAIPFASKTYLIHNKTQISRQWVTIAGYIYQEDESGYTFADSLNFIAE
jgi:hypothetical protein